MEKQKDQGFCEYYLKKKRGRKDKQTDRKTDRQSPTFICLWLEQRKIATLVEKKCNSDYYFFFLA